MKKIIGPFSQLLSMDHLASKGPLKDEQLEVMKNGALITDGASILKVGDFSELIRQHPSIGVEEIEGEHVALPGFIDCHTHICFGGSRARDYAARNNGKTYQEIASEGGGIWDTVTKTRAASQEELEASMLHRLDLLLARGITTVEVKSGYGLSYEQELKLLRAIKNAGERHHSHVISSCLAAHIIPREFDHESDYLDFILSELVPTIKEEKLTNRFDIFIEQHAFTPLKSANYLKLLTHQGFDITVHGDQFTTGGSEVAIEVGASSVDHLEASTEKEIKKLAHSDTVPVVLPGASLGLGLPFSPARKLLDAGCGLAIASDWNPGSAPNGNLLTQAAFLGAYEKLSAAEVFAGITYRASDALGLKDRARLKAGMMADLVGFPCKDYREILYHQGELQPSKVWKNGLRMEPGMPIHNDLAKM